MAEPSVVAERIARAHNGLRRAMTQGGVLVFSPGGHTVEPFETTPAGLDIERLPFPAFDREVTIEEVDLWLAQHREWQAEAYEEAQRLREEAKARHSIRVGEAQRDYGHTSGAANCKICGCFKSTPSSVCGQCGDDPVTHHGDRREYDRAHGRAA